MAKMGSNIRIEAVRTRAFGTIGAAYATVGTPISNPAQMFLVQNFTDIPVMISFDGGVVDHIPVPAYGGIVFDNTANRAIEADGLYVSKGTQIAVKQIGIVAATLGAVYVTSVYSRP
jgi:hypothetical protein